MSVLIDVLWLAFVAIPLFTILAWRQGRELPVVWYAHTVLEACVLRIIHLLVCELVLSPSHIQVLASVIFAQVSHRPFGDINSRVGVRSAGIDVQRRWHIPLVNILLTTLGRGLWFLIQNGILVKALRGTTLYLRSLTLHVWMTVLILLSWLHMKILLS